jgi:hypothetical protein
LSNFTGFFLLIVLDEVSPIPPIPPIPPPAPVVEDKVSALFVGLSLGIGVLIGICLGAGTHYLCTKKKK